MKKLNFNITNLDGEKVEKNEISASDWFSLSISTDKMLDIDVIIIKESDFKDKNLIDLTDEVLSLLEDRFPDDRKGFISHWNNLSNKDEWKKSMESEGQVTASIGGIIEPSKYEEGRYDGVNIFTLKIFNNKGTNNNTSIEKIEREANLLFKDTLDEIGIIESEQQDSNEYYKNPSAYYGVGDSDFISIKRKP